MAAVLVLHLLFYVLVHVTPNTAYIPTIHLLRRQLGGNIFAMETPTIVLIPGVVITWLLLRWATRRPLPYPPGPPGYPLVGYLKAIQDPIWKTYAEWGKKYGELTLKNNPPIIFERSIGSDVIWYNALGSDIIVVNTLKAANELLDKRSSIYSDRFVARPLPGGFALMP